MRCAALEPASRALEVERLLHVRPRKVAVEGAVGTAVPRVASVNIIEGRLERVIKFQAAQVHAAAVERPHGALRDVRMRRVPGVGQGTVVIYIINVEGPDRVLRLI